MANQDSLVHAMRHGDISLQQGFPTFPPMCTPLNPFLCMVPLVVRTAVLNTDTLVQCLVLCKIVRSYGRTEK